LTPPACRAHPWAWGAVKSRLSLESSFKAIRRRRPRPRKIRRRLTAFAGATNKRISGKQSVIPISAMSTPDLPSLPILMYKKTDNVKTVTAAYTLSLLLTELVLIEEHYKVRPNQTNYCP